MSRILDERDKQKLESNISTTAAVINKDIKSLDEKTAKNLSNLNSELTRKVNTLDSKLTNKVDTLEEELTTSDNNLSTKIDNINLSLSNQISSLESTKVTMVDGKDLSENDLTDELKDNYDIAYDHSQDEHAPSNAEENVQVDWNITDTSSDAYIKNKPTAMKNPNKLIFTGAVNAEYDGSSAVTVTIPLNSGDGGEITVALRTTEDGTLYFG